MTTDEMLEKFKKNPPAVGDIFYNPLRGNCQRVIRVYMVENNGKKAMRAQCQSYRPDGKTGGGIYTMALETLKQYLPVTKITVETPGGQWEWTPENPHRGWKAT